MKYRYDRLRIAEVVRFYASPGLDGAMWLESDYEYARVRALVLPLPRGVLTACRAGLRTKVGPAWYWSCGETPVLPTVPSEMSRGLSAGSGTW